MRRFRAAWPLVCVAVASLMVAATARAELEVGDPAPDFELPGSDGQSYRLAELIGEQAVVIAWFPRAFTPG